MPCVKLTKRNIDAQGLPGSGQRLLYDTDLRGFGIRLGARGGTFFAERQIRRRTVRVSIGSYALITPEMARKKAMGVLSLMANGVNPNQAKSEKATDVLTLGESFDGFFETRTNLSPTTLPNYKRSIELYLADWVDRPISELTRQMVLAKHRQISEDHGPVTANNVMRHLRSVYNFTAATVGELPPNPVGVLTQARSWSPERRRRSIIPLHAFPRWFAAARGDTDDARDFLLLTLLTGMRRSEVACLRWENVDLVGETLVVPRTKNGEPLELPLSSFLTAQLADRRRRFYDAEWVFPSHGKTQHLVETKSFVARVAKSSGVKFTLHDLRRTFITVAESLDIPHYALKRLLNHRIASDVTGGYIQIGTERLRAPVNLIAAKILELAHE